MKRPFSTVAGPVLGLIVLAVFVPLSWGCEGFELNWTSVEDTVLLYSLARPEYLDRPSAFDFRGRQRVVVDRPDLGNPQNFDAAFSEIDGEPVLLPAGVFATLNDEPGIAIDSSGTSFDELARAPSDGYVTDAPVPLRTGVVYAIRTRSDGRGCSRYAKLEALDIGADGTLEFRQIRNNLCNDRELIPTDDS